MPKRHGQEIDVGRARRIAKVIKKSEKLNWIQIRLYHIMDER